MRIFEARLKKFRNAFHYNFPGRKPIFRLQKTRFVLKIWFKCIRCDIYFKILTKDLSFLNSHLNEGLAWRFF